MSEYEDAITLANRVLDRPNADYDDDLAILARNFLRIHERREKAPDHEIRLTTYSEFTVPAITPKIPRRQRLVIDYDLNRVALDYALSMIGGLEPGESAFLVADESSRITALALGQEFRLPVILLPPGMLVNFYTWGVVSRKGVIFSTPTA